jgi:hypothetical protein
MAISNLRQQALASGAKTRVQNVTGDQTVKATAGMLNRIILSNVTAAATLTLKDGATTQTVIQIGAPQTLILDIGVPFTTSIVVTPSATTIDALVLYD